MARVQKKTAVLSSIALVAADVGPMPGHKPDRDKAEPA
jgi:hypothetical protein